MHFRFKSVRMRILNRYSPKLSTSSSKFFSDLYYSSFPRDRIASKALVTIVYLWEFAQTLVATRDAFKDLAAGWGAFEQLNSTQWLWFSVPIMSGVGQFFLQLVLILVVIFTLIFSELYSTVFLRLAVVCY